MSLPYRGESSGIDKIKSGHYNNKPREDIKIGITQTTRLRVKGTFTTK